MCARESKQQALITVRVVIGPKYTYVYEQIGLGPMYAGKSEKTGLEFVWTGWVDQGGLAGESTVP